MKSRFRHLNNSSGASLVTGLILSTVVGISLMAFLSQVTLSHQDSSSLRKEVVFLDLLGQVNKASNSPSICTNGLLGTTPTVGQPISFTTAMLGLTEGAAFQNGQLTITKLRWAVIDTPSPNQWTGYLTVQAQLNGTSVFGGNMRTFPKIGADPRTGVKVDLQMAGGVVQSCASAGNHTQYFSFPLNVTSNSNTVPMNGWQGLPTAFSNAAYYVTCSVMDPWAVNHDASGESFGFLSVWGLSPGGFNWHYLQQIGDWIPVGYTLTVNCVAYDP